MVAKNLSGTRANKSLGFGLVLWSIAVFSAVLLFAASIPLPLLFLFGAVWTAGLFVVILRQKSPSDSLLLAVLFVVVFNASYLPLFGAFSGVIGQPTMLYKVALGLRSFWYALSILYVGWAFTKEKYLFADRLKTITIICLFYLAASSIASPAPLDGRLTYLLNSFIPLVMTVFCLGALCLSDGVSKDDGNGLSYIVLLGLLIGTAYFFTLPYFYDVFRPDLGSFFRAAPGEYIAKGGYDPSWGSRIGGFYFNRFVGTFPDPIIGGYFFSAMAYAFFVTRRYILSALIGVLLVLSFSKGAWLFFAQALILYGVGRKNKSLVIPFSLVFVSFHMLVGGILDASNRMHFLGLVGGISSVISGGVFKVIFGYGLGHGGNLGRGYVEGGALGSGWLGSGSESGIGVLVHQLGFGGAILVFLLIWYFLKETSEQAKKSASASNLNSILAIQAIFLSLLINVPLQENCINASVLSSLLLSAILIRTLGVWDKQDTIPK